MAPMICCLRRRRLAYWGRDAGGWGIREAGASGSCGVSPTTPSGFRSGSLGPKECEKDTSSIESGQNARAVTPPSMALRDHGPKLPPRPATTQQ